MEIDSKLAEQALREALERFPQFASYGPRLVWRPLAQGGIQVGFPLHRVLSDGVEVSAHPGHIERGLTLVK